jgi:ABC-type glycerol-3-phosphate transport system substrate-binding protein
MTKKLSRRSFIKLAGLAAAGASLAACTSTPSSTDAPTTAADAAVEPTATAAEAAATSAGAATEPVPTTAPAASETTLSFIWYESRFVDTMKGYISKFEEANPGTKVDLQIIPSDAYLQKLTVQISSGTAPDVFFLVSGQVQNYGAMDACLDLNQYVSKDEVANYREGQITLSTYKDKLVTLPFTATVLTLFINQELFEKSGIQYPTTAADALSRDDFFAAVKKLKDDNKLVEGMFNGSRDFWWLPWFYGNGASLLNDTLDAPTFNSPEAQEVFDLLAQATKDKLIGTPPTSTATTQEVTQLFGQGRQAVYSGGHWDIGSIETAVNGQFKFTAMTFPKQKTGSLALGGDYLAAYAGTKQADMATKFIKYLTSKEITADYSSQHYYLTPRTDATPTYTKYADVMQLVQDQAASMSSPKLTLHRGLPKYADINTVFGAEYQLVMLGQEDSKTALANIDSKVKDILAK